MSDDLEAVSFDELRLLCESLEDDLSDAILIIDRQDDRIEELEAQLAKTVEALRYYAVEAVSWHADNSLLARIALAKIEGEQP